MNCSQGGPTNIPEHATDNRAAGFRIVALWLNFVVGLDP